MAASVGFSWASEATVRAWSVVEITSGRLYEKDGKPTPGGLRDERLGSSRRGTCVTCHKGWSECPGHFGHLELAEPVVHPGVHSLLLNRLRRTCRACHCAHRKAWKKCKVCSVSMEIPNMQELVGAEVLAWLDVEDTPGVVKVLPVPPTTIRPSATIHGNEVRGEDSITKQLLKIIRKNNALARLKKTNAAERVRRAVSGLQTECGNYLYRSKQNPEGCIAERLRKKEGRMRGSLMGKRCNFTARSVITGDPTLHMNQVGVPPEVASVLTVTERVNDYNLERLQRLLPRCKYAIDAQGHRMDLQWSAHHLRLEPGWQVERPLQNGDKVLFNRQPSLHRPSIMCHRVRIMPGRTFRLNLSCTTPYNADFDGDEMNLHALQTVEAQVEAAQLMSVQEHVVTAQSHRPVMSIVQDTLIGTYELTSQDTFLDRADMMDWCMHIDNFTMPPPAVVYPRPLWTGAQAFSMVLPRGVCLGAPTADPYIADGVLLRGQLNKKTLGRSQRSLVHVIFNDVGPRASVDFMSSLQRGVANWFSTQGFSIGVSDFLTTPEVRQRVREVYEETVQELRARPDASETWVNRRLNQARDTMGRAALEAIHRDNRLRRLVHSGSKGSNVNILQIMACLGQQNVKGQRIPCTIGDRALPCFAPGEDAPEARGMVRHSFMEGLTPYDYFFHTIGGREGLVDTAVKTSESGYIQRQLVKCLEALTAHADMSVRDADGAIIQFAYGDDGRDATHLEFVSDGSARVAAPVPVDRLLARQRSLGRAPVIDGGAVPYLLRELEPVPKVRDIVANLLTADEPHAPAVAAEAVERWHRARVAAGEMVGVLAAQSLGEPVTQMTLNSVEWHAELVIRWNSPVRGATKNGSVGALIDGLMSAHDPQHPDPQEPRTTYLELPAGAAEALTVDADGRVLWKPLLAVTRHPPINADGSDTLVRVTTASGRSVTCTKAKSFLVVEGPRVREIAGADLRVGMALPVAFDLPAPDQTHVDLAVYLDKTAAPADPVPLDRAFGQLLGGHLAHPDGSAGDARNHLVRVASAMCNDDPARTKIPAFAYGAPDAFVRGLLDTYVAAVGVVRADGTIACTARSAMLSDGIMLLLHRIGIPSARTSAANEHTVVMSARMCDGRVVSAPPAKLARMNGVLLDPVVEIVEVRSDHPFVYDLTVQDTYNMVEASGIGLRDTFHSAGISAKNVTLGVPRFRELMGVTKKQKTPSVTLTFPSRAEAAAGARRFHKRTLRDLATRQVHAPQDPDPVYAALPEGKVRDAYDHLIELDQTILDGLGMDVYDVVDRVRVSGWVVAPRERRDLPAAIMATYTGRRAHEPLQKFLRTQISGVGATITSASADECKVYTDGSDLRTCLAIDPQATSNDPNDVLRTLGIEAAREVLFRELHAVMTFDGSYVNERHLKLMVDWMTQQGTLTPANRHGVRRRAKDLPIARATFEQPVEVFIDAALRNKRDLLTGISEQLIMGCHLKCGTTMALAVETAAYKEMKMNKPVRMVHNLVADPVERNPIMQPNSWQAPPHAYPPPAAPYAPPPAPYAPWEQPAAPPPAPYAPWEQPAAPPPAPYAPWEQPAAPPPVPAVPWEQPGYSPTSPAAYSPTSPAASGAYSPTSPATYSPTSPAASGAYSPTSPAAYSPTSPAASGAYSPTSPAAYSPSSPAAYSPSSPKEYSPSSPKEYSPSSPAASPSKYVVTGTHGKRQRVSP
jgi:DNA-directed RNA polymerase beta' subunit